MEKIKDLKLFLFDMDGTLYLGDRLFDFTSELLEKIKQSGGKYMFMTNNSSKSVAILPVEGPFATPCHVGSYFTGGVNSQLSGRSRSASSAQDMTIGA